MDRTGRGKGQRIRGRWTRQPASGTSDQATLPGSGSTRPSWRPVERLSSRELLRNKFGGRPFLFSCSSLVGELPNCDPVGENNQEGWNFSFLSCFLNSGFVRNQDFPLFRGRCCNNCGIEREVHQSSSTSLPSVRFQEDASGFRQTLKWLCDFFPILLFVSLGSVSLVPIVFPQQYYSHYHSIPYCCSVIEIF